MDDIGSMQLALDLAKSAEGQTSPNPLVGAVVVKDGQIVGMGAHLKAGEAHAEVHAINMAGDKANGATIYVTLEPCSHFGKTPPCANLVVASGIKRAVIATSDPFPEVAGRGIQILKNAGIQVEVGLLKEEADELNRVFYHFIKEQRPFVTVKTATSLDGKIATVTGESKWITSEESRLDSHHYRHTHDAILVGINTVLADDPTLTTRLPSGGKNPIRIVLDSSLKMQLDAKLVTDSAAPTWVVTTNKAPEYKIGQLTKLGVKVISLDSEKIEVPSLLERLGSEGVTSIFVEGGATVNASFLKARLVNQVITYIAPKLIGGLQAPSAFTGEGFKILSDAFELVFHSVKKIGPDLKIISYPRSE